jgi:hypothetical protein
MGKGFSNRYPAHVQLFGEHSLSRHAGVSLKSAAHDLSLEIRRHAAVDGLGGVAGETRRY